MAINFNKGGRLFYIGAGTSGRLGIEEAKKHYMLSAGITNNPSSPLAKINNYPPSFYLTQASKKLVQKERGCNAAPL